MEKLIKKAEILLLIIGSFFWMGASRSAIPFYTIVAIIIHELGHSVLWFITSGTKPTLSFQAGGLLLRSGSSCVSYAKEASIALGGPAFNLLSARAVSQFTSRDLQEFGSISLGLAALNLLPIDEFDGGRIASSILHLILPFSIAERICDVLSFLSVFFIWSLSVYVLIKTGRNVSFFIFSAIIFLKLFLPTHRKSICEIIKE